MAAANIERRSRTIKLRGRCITALAAACLALISCGGPVTVPDGMVYVRGGCYTMGDSLGVGLPNESPPHKVCLPGFFMDKYEVTQTAFQTVMGYNPARFSDCPECPVDKANWSEAADYCSSLGKRLPTEAEWEYVAREGGKEAYFCTAKDTLTPEDANYGWLAGVGPTPVGSYPPNALGVYDICGNAWEWLADWYDHDYYQKSPVYNPKGPDSGERRAIRGGSWDHEAESLRMTFRWGLLPGQKGYDNGFRCAM